MIPRTNRKTGQHARFCTGVGARRVFYGIRVTSICLTFSTRSTAQFRCIWFYAVLRPPQTSMMMSECSTCRALVCPQPSSDSIEVRIQLRIPRASSLTRVLRSCLGGLPIRRPACHMTPSIDVPSTFSLLVNKNTHLDEK